MSDEIIASYQSGKPTRSNSRELVKAIARKEGLSDAKVRSVLTNAGVYVALPKDKSKIEASDFDDIFKSFAGSPQAANNRDEREKLATSVSENFGYGKWAVDDFYREWRLQGSPADANQYAASKKRSAEKAQREFNEEVNRIAAPRLAEIDKEHQHRMMLLKASLPKDGPGIFNPWIATFILLAFVFCGVLAVIFG